MWDARQKISRIKDFLPANENILDIGAGSGSVTLALRKSGRDVTPVDVKNWSLTEAVTPDIYDGVHLPYASAEFHTALLLTVLHHTQDPEEVLREAGRVADYVVIIEDVYSGPIHRWCTLAADSLLNLEFRGHPHSNRSHLEWCAIFQKMGWQLLVTQRFPMLKFFTQQTYWLKTSSP